MTLDTTLEAIAEEDDSNTHSGHDHRETEREHTHQDQPEGDAMKADGREEEDECGRTRRNPARYPK